MSQAKVPADTTTPRNQGSHQNSAQSSEATATATDGLRPIRVGTRGSAMALSQTQGVADALAASSGRPVELVVISTHGDRSTAPIASLGSTGVFVSALRDALTAGEVDVAVHSYKDLPTAPADGIALGAVPKRDSAADVLISAGRRKLAELPPGARIGTGAPRRVAQLRAYGRRTGQEFDIVPIRGNGDTRIGKVTSGELAAVVLAEAGLLRLGRTDEIAEVIAPEVMLPAPAQGALAVECRADDRSTAALLAPLDDTASRARAAAERRVLSDFAGATNAGCSSTVATATTVVAGRLVLRANVTAEDGSDAVELSVSTDIRKTTIHDADDLGRRAAAGLLAAGAAEIMGVPQ